METAKIVELLKNAKRIFVAFNDWKHTKYGKRPCFLIFAEINDQITEIIDVDHPYWDKKRQSYVITAIGTNNVDELFNYFITFSYHFYGEKYAHELKVALLEKTYRLFKD